MDKGLRAFLVTQWAIFARVAPFLDVDYCLLLTWCLRCGIAPWRIAYDYVRRAGAEQLVRFSFAFPHDRVEGAGREQRVEELDGKPGLLSLCLLQSGHVFQVREAY